MLRGLRHLLSMGTDRTPPGPRHLLSMGTDRTPPGPRRLVGIGTLTGMLLCGAQGPVRAEPPSASPASQAPQAQPARGSAAAGTPATADALSTRRDVANVYFWEGRRAAEAGDLATACDRFARSLALDRSPGTLLNLANCEESRGNVASAWLRYSDAVARMKPDDRRLSLASDRIALLEPRLPRLTLRAPEPRPAGMRVSLDGDPLGEDAFGADRPLDPGTHHVRVSAKGRALRDILVVLGAGESKSLAVEPGPLLPSRSAGPVAVSRSPGALSASSPGALSAPRLASMPRQRIAGFSLLGLGGAGVVLGAIAGGMVLVEKGIFDQHCSAQGACRDQAGLDAAHRGVTWATTSNVAFAAGAVVAAVGLVVALTSPSRPAGSGTEQATTTKE